MTIYLEGKHKLELVHNNFQTKIMQFMVEKSRMTRRDVIMDSLAPSLSYHTMEGVHGELVDYKGETEINKTEVEMHVQSGHFWKLLPIVGQHTISVGEVTRLVKVMPGKLTIVKFEVERKGMPWLVVFSIMATGLGLSFLVMSICRLVRKIIFKQQQEAPTQPMGGGKGFEAREVIKKPYFPDDCEEDSPLFDF